MAAQTETVSETAPARPSASPDFEAIKIRQQNTWASGDFSVIGTTLQIVGESLCEAVDLRAGATVLDVAAGNGNAAIAAARRWCDVTAVDFVPALLADGERRAAADRLNIHWRVGDAEALPFENASFDVVLSTYGVMFAPNQAQAASELVRVCKPGGRIGLANWTPNGFIGQLFKVIGAHVPPPAGLESPARWGVPAHLAEWFHESATRIHVEPKMFMFRYTSPQHFVEVFRSWYGPVLKAFAALEHPKRHLLEADILALVGRFNQSGDATAVIPAEYVEVTIDRR
jgi:ubiquinone/menaquinone biosynthesis C-methylase UbiE